MIKKWLRILGFLLVRMDIPILAPLGTNFLGMIMAFAAFLPLGIFIRQFGSRIEGVVNFFGGCIVFGVDWIYRRKFAMLGVDWTARRKYEILFEPEQGGRMLYLPIWIWGILWMISGLITSFIELVKG